jgi:hypothetical protein
MDYVLRASENSGKAKFEVALLNVGTDPMGFAANGGTIIHVRSIIGFLCKMGDETPLSST